MLKDVNGTVFVGVGGVICAILAAFGLYYLIKSISAKRTASRATDSEKRMYNRYSMNSSMVYGDGTNYDTTYRGNVSKLPFLSERNSRFFDGGDNSTIFDATAPSMANEDLTMMYISPTKDVMSHNRSLSNLFAKDYKGPLGNTVGVSNPSVATNRHSQLMLNLYIDSEISNSDYDVADKARRLEALTSQPKSRSELPSMYLDDLIDRN